MDNELLYRFFNGETSFEEESEIKKWYDASEENRKHFYEERKLFDAIILNGDVPDKSHKRRRSPVFVKVLEFAAMIAVAVVSALVVTDKRQDRQSRLAVQSITVPAGQRLDLVLPDGTSVCLNSGSTISYPSAFSSKNRSVTLDGEAYFEVYHDEAAPFVVHTSKYDVTVLGTTFNVDAYSSKDEFCTSLIEGSVKLSSPSDKSGSIVLKPLEQAFLSDGGISVRQFSPESVISYKDGLLVFNHKSLEEITKEFQKFYGVEIRFTDSKKYNKLFTGKFRQNEGVEYAMKILQSRLGFKYDIQGDVVNIY